MKEKNHETTEQKYTDDCPDISNCLTGGYNNHFWVAKKHGNFGWNSDFCWLCVVSKIKRSQTADCRIVILRVGVILASPVAHVNISAKYTARFLKEDLPPASLQKSLRHPPKGEAISPKFNIPSQVRDCFVGRKPFPQSLKCMVVGKLSNFVLSRGETLSVHQP